MFKRLTVLLLRVEEVVGVGCCSSREEEGEGWDNTSFAEDNVVVVVDQEVVAVVVEKT
jgi:hypothetical protein